MPRFAPENVTPAQLALAWVLAQTPGSRRSRARLHRLEENLGAVDVELTPEDLREIDDVSSKITVHGHRYSEGSQHMIDR